MRCILIILNQINALIRRITADIDGLFIRSLLMTFFFKVFPEIIKDGRLYIAEPPLYRINDKKDPFVINKEDYINRYIEKIIKDYKIGYQSKKDELQVKYFNKKELHDFLFDTSFYLNDMELMIKHYKINDRLLELVLEEFINIDYINIKSSINKINIQHLMNRIGEEFNELYYDDKSGLIKGAVDGKHQLLEITDQLIHKSKSLLDVMKIWSADENSNFILRNNKTASEHKLSLLGVLKILKKYQPDILHRFKGLGENDADDIKDTIMDPNSRTLIRVMFGDIENDMKVFQMLRGNTLTDLMGRKQMMANFQISRADLDT